jgi:ATP-dependent DNA helicase RecG
MRDLMSKHQLAPPAFESATWGDQFAATFLFHHFLDVADLAWLRTLTREPLSDDEARALVFVREVGAIDNGVFRSFGSNDTLNASAHLRRLRDLGLLVMKGSGSRTYYVGSEALLPTTSTEGDPHQLGSNPHQFGPDPHQLSPDPHQLPAELAALVATAGQRPRQPLLRALVRKLCAWRPSSARELAGYLGGRDPKVLLRQHLSEMVETGELAYTIPQMPNHPAQRYTLPQQVQP